MGWDYVSVRDAERREMVGIQGNKRNNSCVHKNDDDEGGVTRRKQKWTRIP